MFHDAISKSVKQKFWCISLMHEYHFDPVLQIISKFIHQGLQVSLQEMIFCFLMLLLLMLWESLDCSNFKLFVRMTHF